MKLLIPSALFAIAGIHLVLPPQSPDITLFYLLPLLAWARLRPTWAAILPALLLTVLLNAGVSLIREKTAFSEPMIPARLILNATACLGAAALLIRREETLAGGKRKPGGKPAASGLTETGWMPSTRPDALFPLPGSEGQGQHHPPPGSQEAGTHPEPSLSIRRTEAALLRSEARLQFALEGSNTGVWEWDMVTNKNYYSTVWRTMLGYGPDEIANTQEAWVAITHPDDVPVCEASIQRHLRGESPVHKAEHRLRAKDGSWRWILTKGRILQRDAEGRPLRMFGTHTDITATKKLTAELSAEKNRLELATKAGKFGIWETNFITGALSWDKRMHRLFGVAEKDFGGSQADWVRALHPDDREAALEHWRRVQEDPAAKTYEAEFRIVHGLSGELRNMRANAIILRAGDGTVSHAIGLNWDVTEERVASETLIKAKEAAEAGEKARSDFMASISHELRTPMNGVLGMADLLLDSPLNQAQTEMVGVMRRSGATLLGIINDILDFSHIEAGQMRIQPAPFHLNDILRDTSRLMEPQASRKRIFLNCRIGPGLDPVLVGDAGRLQQIVINLVGNAIKFTEQGGVTLAILPLQIAEDHLRFRIEVKDSGIGIPSRHHEKLFAPFKQVDQSSHRKFGGTGLGLAISSQIAEAMGSQIRFESVEQAGSTFWLDLTLPRSPRMDTDASGTGEGLMDFEGETTGALIPASGFRPLNLLLVEDNEANQHVATLLLEQYGHQVRVAGNGMEALHDLQKEEFDLILMDCRMPVLDGFETTRRIRAGQVSPPKKDIPIIALTASGMPGDHERCLEIGMNGYALKPINRRELAEAFRHCGLELSAPRAEKPRSLTSSLSTTPTAPSASPLPAGPEAEGPALDTERMEMLRKATAPDGRSVLAVCIQLLLEEIPPRLDSLRECVERLDYDGIAESSHSIAGNCASIGATALYGIMRSLQTAARAGAGETLEADLILAAAEWEKLKSRLEKEVL